MYYESQFFGTIAKQYFCGIMSWKSHYFIHNPSQNQHGKTPVNEEEDKMAPPETTPDVVTELQDIRNILKNLAKDMTGVKNGIESLIEMVKTMGNRITEAKSRISNLEDEEAKRGPVLQELSKQNTVLQEKVAVLEGFLRRQNIRITGVKKAQRA